VRERGREIEGERERGRQKTIEKKADLERKSFYSHCSRGNPIKEIKS